MPSANQTLYVVVGGKGTDATLGTDSPGGYNGGGLGTWDGGTSELPSGTGETSGGGGGATHIATTTGVLSSLSGNRSAVLIVAGGGGGASWNTNGGAGGGLTAGAGANAGTVIPAGFGYGANATGTGNGDGVGGGGGGYQGGRAYDYKSNSSNAEGGTGYIGGVTSASTTAGLREGNGYARITLYKRGSVACASEAKAGRSL